LTTLLAERGWHTGRIICQIVIQPLVLSDKGFLLLTNHSSGENKMFRKLSLTLLTLAMLLSACASSTATPIAALAPTTTPKIEPTKAPAVESITLIDGLKREVKLTKPAQRIVSIAPSSTELLFAVGAGAQVVGREELSDYPEAAKKVQSIGSAFGKLNTEAIVALKPDLILAAEINPAEQVKTLEDLGLTVYWLANPKDFAGLSDNLKIIGALTGHTAEAEKTSQSIEVRYQAVIEKIATSSKKPTVFYEIDATDPTKPYTTGPGTFIDKLIDLAGGYNIGRALKDQFAQISSEELVKVNPDLMVLGDALYGVTPESIGQRAGWAKLAAVKNKTIFTFDDNLASRPGPRLIDGLEAFAKLLHPELFK
jgi:iron complex transport system substrate-binding protein